MHQNLFDKIPHQSNNIVKFQRQMVFKQHSVIVRQGMEGKYVSKDCFKDRNIAVLTSGGDSQGMNSAVRAVVRMGIYCGCKVFYIKEGYQGMVDGGENIIEATWASVSGIMHLGGTVIGSARCQDFRYRSGRLQAAKNLVCHEITNLVVIGGDGSLTGASLFRLEWPDLLEELLSKGEITNEQMKKCFRLNIVGMIGSIDNDFCGTDMTIGTDSALHRIIEACDAISSTAHSHQRCFVLEVMGRHCGYLALMSAIAAEAEWVFIPESPPESGWEERLCSKLGQNRDNGQRVNIIIVAEGAIDNQCNPITADYVKNLIKTQLNIDTRVTVFGHVQRGGRPSAFDRILGLRMGADAVLALIDADKDESLEACVISLIGNQICRVPLMKCVEKTKGVGEAMTAKDFEKAANLRGDSFKNNLNSYIRLSKLHSPKLIEKKNIRVAILNVGAPACGTNAAMMSFTKIMISNGFEVVGINEGFEGLAKGVYEELTWTKVKGWVGIGGSILGIRRDTLKTVCPKLVSQQIKALNLSGLLLIGGFEAFSSAYQMYNLRKEFDNFNIPILCIPATISNNVPGTDFSLGSDSSLNEVAEIVDKLKQSALGTKRRAFVLETQGGYCGYLATMAGLAGGADAAYIFEEQFGIDDLREDVKHLKAKIADNVQRGLVIVNEKANTHYNAKFIFHLFGEEGRGIFDTRINVPGHLQQGGDPSPFDRTLGIKLGCKSADWFVKQFVNELSGSTTYDVSMLGLVKSEYKFTLVSELAEISNFKFRLPMDQWWLNLRPLLRIMAKHGSLYTSDSIMYGVVNPVD